MKIWIEKYWLKIYRMQFISIQIIFIQYNCPLGDGRESIQEKNKNT